LYLFAKTTIKSYSCGHFCRFFEGFYRIHKWYTLDIQCRYIYIYIYIYFCVWQIFFCHKFLLFSFFFDTPNLILTVPPPLIFSRKSKGEFSNQPVCLCGFLLYSFLFFFHSFLSFALAHFCPYLLRNHNHILRRFSMCSWSIQITTLENRNQMKMKMIWDSKSFCEKAHSWTTRRPLNSRSENIFCNEKNMCH
jgi:hypothetical protein